MIVGIIDSGLGAINLLNHLLKQSKHATYLVYLDYAYNPFGNKSKDELIKRYKIGEKFLLDKGAELIIVACNTLSMIAHKENSEALTPIFYFQNKIKDLNGALLATQYTISNNIYKCNKQLVCNDLVPYIEGYGQINKDKYQSLKGTIFLGCTHYSLVKKVFNKNCMLIDSTLELAKNVSIINSPLKVTIYLTKIDKNIKNHLYFYLILSSFAIKRVYL